MKTGCCGSSLGTGAIVIGTLGAIIGAFFSSMFMRSVILPQPEVERLKCVLYMVIFLAQMVTGVMLVTGVDKSRPSYVRPWLRFSYFKIIFDTLGLCTAMYYLLVAHAPINVVLSVAATIAVILGLEMYCIVLVLSFYKQLTGTDGIIPLKEEV